MSPTRRDVLTALVAMPAVVRGQARHDHGSDLNNPDVHVQA